LSLDRMIEKARRLLENGRVERIGGERYNMVGDHGTYTVAQNYEGKVSCNCPSFRSKGSGCRHNVNPRSETPEPISVLAGACSGPVGVYQCGHVFYGLDEVPYSDVLVGCVSVGARVFHASA